MICFRLELTNCYQSTVYFSTLMLYSQLMT